LASSYNAMPHTATGYAPAYLLRGYTPITGSTILHSPNSINRPFSQSKLRCGAILEIINQSLRPEALEMVEQLSAEIHQVQEALILDQHFQKRAYNKGRLTFGIF
jgi:hypothetical protein